MKQGPLELDELDWLDSTLLKYTNEHAILDASELDGLLTAILSGPNPVMPGEWLMALWGGEENAPVWESEQELKRFMDLCFQHMNDIAERLNGYPDQFEPLFGTHVIDDEEFTILEQWCFGYMRGVALDDWSQLPESLKPSLEVIALHGLEENFPKLDDMTHEDFVRDIEGVRLAALRLHAHWLSQRSTMH
ncbi:YecA family protein [Pantoea sp. B65]|uniref:YecA/YgfB family protein n=1 Tax=Pantoea sp. B65 TaxID=2813359 RepID=UPI0039B506DF